MYSLMNTPIVHKSNVQQVNTPITTPHIKKWDIVNPLEATLCFEEVTFEVILHAQLVAEQRSGFRVFQ